LLNLYIQRQLN